MRSVFELCAGEHVESLVDALGTLTRCSPERFVDGVFNRGSAELGSGSAECMLVEVDQVLAHHPKIYTSELKYIYGCVAGEEVH